MPRGRKKQQEQQANEGPRLEATLFKSADKMRGSIDPSEYKHVALGLVFLRYLSAAFEAKREALSTEEHADIDDKEEYAAAGVFWVPDEARWSGLRGKARSSDIGVRIDNAMRAIEQENPSLAGVLPKDFARPQLTPEMLGSLIDLFTNSLRLVGGRGDFDLLGRVYEYFLGQFAGAEGKRGGEFYTPPSVVRLAVEMTEPVRGKVYDPCCGTGGFFVQSERFIEAHKGGLGDLAVYGQERNQTTWRLAKMNLAIRRIEAEIAWNSVGTLLDDALPDERFDTILANPPFNISDWSGELKRQDKRWIYGAPPVGNANYAWLQHIVHHLKPGGVAAVVLANGSMSSQQGGENVIRAEMVKAGMVDCMVALPPQMFFGTGIPACMWILAKDRSNGVVRDERLRDRRGEILFINARKLGFMETRTFRAFAEDDINLITRTYHAWRGQAATAGAYEEVPGFCRSVPTSVVLENSSVLTPRRYVGWAEAEVASQESVDQMLGLLRNQIAQGQELDRKLQQHLEVLGS